MNEGMKGYSDLTDAELKRVLHNELDLYSITIVNTERRIDAMRAELGRRALLKVFPDLDLKVGDQLLGTEEVDNYFRRWPVEGIEGYVSRIHLDYCTCKFNYVGVVKNVPFELVGKMRRAYLAKKVRRGNR